VNDDNPAGRWDARYRDTSGSLGPASLFVRSQTEVLPPTGTALDIGSGEGRNARYLVSCGLDVTLMDVSDVALATAQRAFEAEGLAARFVCRDVEADGLPDNEVFDVVLMHLFFDADVFFSASGLVRPGGVLLLCQPTVINLERHPRPGARFLLEEGELGRLAGAIEDRFDVLEASEQWRSNDRHDAWLVARCR
jgi:tellurite methyltransferase